MLFEVSNLLINSLLCTFQAEDCQTKACEKFEAMSARGKEELMSFRKRRVSAFKKSLVEMAELEIKHARTQYDFLKASLDESLLKLQEA